MNSVKGFYVYVEEDACFDCGRSDRNILGWYKGEPDKETLEKIAKSYVEKGVIPYDESQLAVYDGRVFADNGFAKTLYETETFTLAEVE